MKILNTYQKIWINKPSLYHRLNGIKHQDTELSWFKIASNDLKLQVLHLFWFKFRFMIFWHFYMLPNVTILGKKKLLYQIPLKCSNSKFYIYRQVTYTEKWHFFHKAQTIMFEETKFYGQRIYLNLISSTAFILTEFFFNRFNFYLFLF